MIPFELHFSQMARVFNVDSEVMAELSVNYNTDSNKVDAVI